MQRRTFLHHSLSLGLITATYLPLLPHCADAEEPGPYARLTVDDDFTRWENPFRFRYILTNPTTKPLILNLRPNGLLITAGKNVPVFYEPEGSGIGRPDHIYSVHWRGTLEPEQPLAPSNRLIVAPGETRSFTGQWVPNSQTATVGETVIRAWLSTLDGPVLPVTIPVYVAGREPGPNDAPVMQSIAALIDVSGTDRGRARLGRAYGVMATYVGTPRANRDQPTSSQDWLIEENGKQLYVAWRKENETWRRFLRPGGQVRVTGRLRRSPRGVFYLEPDAMSGVLPAGPQPQNTSTP